MCICCRKSFITMWKQNHIFCYFLNIFYPKEKHTKLSKSNHKYSMYHVLLTDLFIYFLTLKKNSIKFNFSIFDGLKRWVLDWYSSGNRWIEILHLNYCTILSSKLVIRKKKKMYKNFGDIIYITQIGIHWMLVNPNLHWLDLYYDIHGFVKLCKIFFSKLFSYNFIQVISAMQTKQSLVLWKTCILYNLICEILFSYHLFILFEKNVP